jgi:hypothetical protein
MFAYTYPHSYTHDVCVGWGGGVLGVKTALGFFIKKEH